MVYRGDISGYISSLVLMEICWYLESKNKVDALRDVINVIEESRITVAEVTGNDVSQAVELKRLKKNIALNDLINYIIMSV
jgi:predicted nucleic acid-binding protein